MTADLKAQWIAALRSGKYQQGRGALQDAAGYFCCLGVLCDVAGVPYVAGAYDFGAHVSNTSVYGTLGAAVDRPQRLIDMNDTGKSFREIADWIERHVDAN